MWLPNSVIEEVDKVARIRYVDRAACILWNKHRREGELRMLTGWGWVSRDGRSHRQGLKTVTVCYRDAWYALVAKAEAPRVARLRAVA
jgi:hypothetical protein